MIGVLETWDHSRPIASLNRADLQKLSVAAISGFILEHAKQRQNPSIEWDDLNIDVALAG